MMSSSLGRGLIAALIVSVSILGCNQARVAGAGCQTDQECIDQNGGLDRWYCNDKKSPPTCDLRVQHNLQQQIA